MQGARPAASKTAPRLGPPRGFLLTMGGFLGSLAAARDLGRHGIEVVLADPEPDTFSAHSRFVTRRLTCPSLSEPEAWVRWLLDFGRREPGYVLYPTSDNVCWLLERHRDALSAHFYLYLPRPGAMRQILNKKTLHTHCRELGIDQPDLWTPQQALSPETHVRFPVLVKPPTQAGLRAFVKGAVAEDRAALRLVLDRFSSRFTYRPDVLAEAPALSEPLVQAFHPESAGHTYSLAGFYAPEQGIYLLRAARKVLQQPLRIGLGLGFESQPVHPGPARQLRELMDRLGYRGAFEVEFIHLAAQNRFLLIDFNPRFYGQMGFELARGLPIPRLCYLAAVGEWDALRALAAPAQHWDHEALWRFRDGWMLRIFVRTQRLGGNLSRQQLRDWLQWSDSAFCGDPLRAADDPQPARAARRQVWLDLARHPRSTLRTFFRP